MAWRLTREGGRLFSMVVWAFAAQTLWATNADTWKALSVEHWKAFQRGDQFLAMGYRSNDRLSNELAHLTDAYLALHSLTGDAGWVTEAARQLDAVAARTDTWHRNGTGWSTPRYSSNLIQNGSGTEEVTTATELVLNENFEAAGSAALAPGWARIQSTTATAYRDANAGTGPSGGMVLVTDAVNWVSVDYAFTNLKPDTAYELAADGWTDSAAVRPWMDVRMGETAWTWFSLTPLESFPAGVVNEWRRLSFRFRTPAVLTGPVRVRLVVSAWQSAGARIKFDNVELREVTASRIARWENLLGNPLGIGAAGAITLTNNGTSWQTVGQRLVDRWVIANPNYQPGARYRLRFQARTSVNVMAVATVYNRRTGQTIGQVVGATGDWQEFELNFFAPGFPGEDLWLLLYPSPYSIMGATVSFRAVEIRQYAGHIIDEALMLNAFLQFAQHVSDNPALAPVHAARVASYLSLAQAIAGQWNRDWVEHQDFGVFRYADDGAASVFSRATTPTNYFTEAGTTYLRLHRLTGNPEYRRKAGLLAKALRRLITLENDCLIWPYYRELLPPGSVPPAAIPIYPEDTAHANSTVLFMLEAFEAGLEFDDLDVLRLSNTFLHRLWNRNSNAPSIAVNVTGAPAGASLPMLWQWIKLATYVPEMLPVIHDVTEKYAAIDYQGPVHDYLRVWYDQGWRVQQKAWLALQLGRYQCLRDGDFASRSLTGAWSRYDHANGFAGVGVNGALRLGPTGNSAWNVVEQLVDDPLNPGPYEPGASYMAQFRGMVEGAQVGTAYVYDYTARRVLGRVYFSSSTWQKHSFQFTGPAEPGHVLRLRLHVTDRSAVGGFMSVDNVLIMRGLPINR